MSGPDPLAAFRAADPPYQHAREELRALEYARDQALLDARRSGVEERESAGSHWPRARRAAGCTCACPRGRDPRAGGRTGTVRRLTGHGGADRGL